MAHKVKMTIPRAIKLPPIELGNNDVEIEVSDGKGKLGVLYISKGGSNGRL